MATKPRLVSELAPAPHLEAADITTDTVVTIKQFDRHLVGEQQVMKGVMYFEEFDRGMVINRTNCKMLIHHFGNNLDLLPGRQITLYATETTFGNKQVPCLRIRKELPAEAKSKAEQKVTANA